MINRDGGRLGAIGGMVWYGMVVGVVDGCYCHARSLRAPAPKLVDEGGREERQNKEFHR